VRCVLHFGRWLVSELSTHVVRIRNVNSQKPPRTTSDVNEVDYDEDEDIGRNGGGHRSVSALVDFEAGLIPEVYP